jgi:CheY-like chemotaxis protein
MSTDRFGAAILIVDDLEANVQLLERVLRRGGYVAASSTTNPSEVCALHRQNLYDLIILDLQMPVMDGFAVLAALRDCDAQPRAAVLVMSADPSQSQRSLEAGATSFISKPFVMSDVLATVKSLLARPTSRPIGPLIFNAA